MTNETLEIIKRRRSVRSFSQRQIGEKELKAVVEAGQFAPNGGGEAWHFTMIQNAEVLDRINRLAKQYASTCGLPWLEELGKDESFHSTYRAPALILVSAPTDSVTAVYDVSAATQNMLIAAQSLDLASCWGYFATQAFEASGGDALRQELGIPEGYHVYTSVMLGYGDGPIPPAPPRKPDTVTYIP